MYLFRLMTVFMAQNQHNALVAWGTLETGIPLLDPDNQQGRSASAGRDITHLLVQQGDQNSCMVKGFMTIGV